jgi:solute carrier family 25 S-adenosylmethionine transporter 26
MVVALHPLAVEIAAGISAGAVKTLAFYPLDTLTTLREVRVAKAAAAPLLRVRESYAGCLLAVVGIVPYALCFHTAFYLCEAALARLAIFGALAKVCAGTCGAIAAAAVGVPVECLKHRIQLQAKGYTTPAMALATTLRAEGVRGLYRGLGSTLARNVPYNVRKSPLCARARALAPVPQPLCRSTRCPPPLLHRRSTSAYFSSVSFHLLTPSASTGAPLWPVFLLCPFTPCPPPLLHRRSTSAYFSSSRALCDRPPGVTRLRERHRAR